MEASGGLQFAHTAKKKIIIFANISEKSALRSSSMKSSKECVRSNCKVLWFNRDSLPELDKGGNIGDSTAQVSLICSGSGVWQDQQIRKLEVQETA